MCYYKIKIETPWGWLKWIGGDESHGENSQVTGLPLNLITFQALGSLVG